MNRESSLTTSVELAREGRLSEQQDELAAEEPLAIELCHRGQIPLSLTMTMRTPGEDEDLVTGLLLNEGFIEKADDILQMTHSGAAVPPHFVRNTLCVTLSNTVNIDESQMQRFAYTSAACGICGKTALEVLELPYRTQSQQPAIEASLLYRLPTIMEREQRQFARTGGIHGCALFNDNGELLLCREDIGRHNALDKLVGAALRSGVSLDDKLLLLSGRVGYELVQKAAQAGIGLIAAIGAPSSLAYRAAKQTGITLAGFIKADQLNIYNMGSRPIIGNDGRHS